MKKIIKNSIVSVLILASFYACRPEPLPNISTPTTPTNSSVTPPSSLTITENNDSVFVADSAYWRISNSTGCATIYAFAQGNRNIKIFLGVCGVTQLLSDTFIVDEIGGSPQYLIGLKSYKVIGAQPLIVDALANNMTSGSFDMNMQGNIYTGMVNGTFGQYPSYSSIPGMKVKAVWENIPFRP